MNTLIHALNTGTLAAWLSVAGFGTVGLLLPSKESVPKRDQPEKLVVITVTPDVIIGADVPSVSPEDSAPSPPEALPSPPPIPDTVTSVPLPEIPDFPALKKVPIPAPAPSKPSSRPESSPAQVRSTGKTASAVKSNSDSTAKGPSEASRLSAGKMPKPSYPSEAKRKNQTGTVIVEFMIDASGQVISAYAKSSSGWPILDSEAIRTVRRWSFPPGGIMKIQRPIVFRLQ